LAFSLARLATYCARGPGLPLSATMWGTPSCVRAPETPGPPATTNFLASSLTAWGPPTSAKYRTARALVKTAESDDSILATESQPPGRAR